MRPGLPASEHVPRPHRWLLHGGRPASRWLIRRRFSVSVHHGDRVPRRGPVILASNHIGWADGPLLSIFSPRPAHTLTKVELFAGPRGAFLRTCGQIPLHRFERDPRAVRTCLRVLRAGGALGVFPEGRRGGGELVRVHGGAGYLALVTGAPVVPVVVLGTREPGGSVSGVPGRGAHVDLVYGEPVTVAPVDWPRTREQVVETSLLLRQHMLALVDEAREVTGRGLPGPVPPGELEDDPVTGVIETRERGES